MRTDRHIAPRRLREPLTPRAERHGRRASNTSAGLVAVLLGRRCVQADVSNLVKAVGQDVLNEATKEVDRRESLDPVALGAESHGRVGDAAQATVGDADAMGVT